MERFAKEEEEEEEILDEDPWNSTPGYGKVYIEYETVEESKRAQIAVAGRRFDGRMIITSFLPEDRWANGILEPDELEPGADVVNLFPPAPSLPIVDPLKGEAIPLNVFKYEPKR